MSTHVPLPGRPASRPTPTCARGARGVDPHGAAGPDPRVPTPARAVDIAWLMGSVAGCSRGLTAGRRRALVRIIEARFGALDATTRRWVHRLAADRLDACIDRAATADHLSAVATDAERLSGEPG